MQQPPASRSVATMSYADILSAHRQTLSQADGPPRYAIRVLSNITVAPLKEILEVELGHHGVPAAVTLGGYDTVVQDSLAATQTSADIVFWELAAAFDGVAQRIDGMSAQALQALGSQLEQDLDFLLHNLRSRPFVVFNRPSATLFTPSAIERSPLDELARRLNDHLDKHKPDNLLLVDIDRCIADVSRARAVDWRLWRNARLLYSTDFLRHYASQVSAVFRALAGRARKVLVFDCDNTLWDGILGEDGTAGIGLDPTTARGRPYAEVQSLALGLQQRGVLLALCSKNNPEDVDAVLASHPQMILRDQHLAIKKVNWNNKADNLREIARELNLGLDSLVFVDDSDFEADLVESLLPEVTVVRVPAAREQYVQRMRACRDLFWSPRLTAEDAQRTEMIREQSARSDEAARFADVGAYLKSLQLRMTVYTDARDQAARMAQLTQKTNQFNLTTIRRSQAQMSALVESPSHRVFTFSLSDRFGDLGITGLAIAALGAGQAAAEIDTFLLSCRALGRGAEQAFLSFVLASLHEHGAHSVAARYVPSAKNAQTAGFYDAAGFALERERDGDKHYRLELRGAPPLADGPIEIIKGEST
jgi:FkbH-like protein